MSDGRDSLLKRIEKICKNFGIFSSWLILLLVFVTLLQVCLRYFFQSSSNALEELKWHLFGASFLLSLAFVYQENEHVRVDIFYTRFSQRKRLWLESVCLTAIVLPFCCLMIYFGVRYSLLAYGYHNGLASDHLSNHYFLGKNNGLYLFFSSVERLLREWIIRGEMSSNWGGLPARWIIKMVIPFGFLLLLLQSASSIFKNILELMKIKSNKR